VAAFTEQDIDWACPDVSAILLHGGLLSVALAEVEVLTAWLTERTYVLHTCDCGRGFHETQRQLGELFRWEEQFGYRLESGKGNLDALHDGFGFPATPGGRTALLVPRIDALADHRAWVLGFLAIAAEHSTYQLALGCRFLTILPLEERSDLVGAQVSAPTVLPPWPLRQSAFSRR
jgi:hypothetical protein